VGIEEKEEFLRALQTWNKHLHFTYNERMYYKAKYLQAQRDWKKDPQKRK
jgi:hypothetical protein